MRHTGHHTYRWDASDASECRGPVRHVHHAIVSRASGLAEEGSVRIRVIFSLFLITHEHAKK